MTKASELVSPIARRLPTPRASNGGPPLSARRPAPLALVAVALLLGVLVARLIDWRSHAHPHD